LALSETRQIAAEERTNAIARDLETLNRANNLIESGRTQADFSEWAKAEADFTAALKLRPDHSSAWLARGQLYARLHLWDLAAGDFQNAFKLEDLGSLNSLYCNALLRLRVGDEAGFRGFSYRMMKQFDRATDPRGWESDEIARAYLLAAEPILAPDRLVLLTERAVDAGRTPMRLACLGTALYRAGRYEAGLKPLRESRAAGPGWFTWADAVTAMIHHRLGQPERAREALRSAAGSVRRRYEGWCDNFGAATTGLWWNDTQGELYFREAARLIEMVEPKEDPLQWTHRGDSLLALGRTDEARASYQRAIELSRAPHFGLARRAELFVRVGDWKNAFNDYERLIAERSGDASLRDALAWRLCTCPEPEYRDYRRAVELARRAVTLDGTASKHWNTLALALYRTRDWPGSVKAVLKAMEMTDADDVRDWFLLAICQWHIAQEHRARQLFLHALRRIPAGADQHEYLAELRHEAEALFDQPEPSTRGSLAESRDDPSAYTLLLEIEPGAQWIYRLRADACIRLKLWDQVIADTARRIPADPRNYHLWYCDAAARLGAGDVAGYRSVRTGILTQFGGTKDSSIATHLCHICATLPAEPAEAEAMLRFAEFAVTGTPGNPRVRGAMNYRAGRYEATIADFDRSAPVFPQRAWDRLFLAMAHYRLGHTVEAKRSLNEAEEWIERANRLDGTGSRVSWIGWYELIEVEHLLREARALIR
jgi:tetratricopeptide (TPR) repeat protein